FEQPAILIDVHGQRRNLARDIELPVPVARRVGLEVDISGASGKDAIFASHYAALICFGGVPDLGPQPFDMHNNSSSELRPAFPTLKICILLQIYGDSAAR